MKYLAKLVERENEKIFQTLYGHSHDSLIALNNWITANKNTLAQFCSRWKMKEDSFLRSVVWAVALHDIGKAIPPFQRNILQGKRTNRYPHPFFSLPVLLAAYQGGLIKPLLPEYTLNPEYPLIEVLSVMAHHSQLYNGLYSDRHADVTINADALKIIEQLAKDIQKFSIKTDGKLESVPSYEIRKLITDLFQRDVTNATSMWEKIKLKSVYSFFFSLLRRSDIIASAKFRDFASAIQTDVTIFDGVLELSEDDRFDFAWVDKKTILKDKSPYPFQRTLIEVQNPYVMLLAPCGRGKTEGALLWAIEKFKKYNLNRIIFALPTQVTSNAMQDRLRQIFGENNVGLYHGRSSIKLKEEKLTDDPDLDSERILEEIRDENFRSEVYWQPVVVTTVDHLLYTFVHGFPQADFALGNLQTSVIIFDEIHYYEKQLLSHLKQLFRVLRQMQIPHLLMSGTFPDFLIDEIQSDFAKENGEYQLVFDDDGLNFQPFQILKYNGTLVRTKDEDGNKNPNVSDEFINAVIKSYNEGLVQFIILNTVFRAQTVYQELKNEIEGDDDGLMLLHSQFTYLDRRNKERRLTQNLKKPFILVATQVIEVSLDISSDIMYTEIAPMDALGQRAGRLNRGNSHFQSGEHIYRLIVFEAENYYPYVEKKELLAKTWDELKNDSYSYKNIREVCNRVYSDARLGDSNFLSIFRECTLFGYHHSDIRWSEEEGKRFKPREDSFMKIDVIPYQFYEQLGEKALSAEYLVSVPLWWYIQNDESKLSNFTPHEKNGRTYLLTRIPYTSEIGFDQTKIMEMNLDEGSNIL